MFARLMLAAVLAVGIAAAQDEGGGGGGGMGGGGGRGGGGGGDMAPSMGPARKQTKMEMLFDKLKLNKEQKEDAAAILQAANEKAAPVRDQLNAGRSRIANDLISKKSDEDIKKLLATYSQVTTMMTQIEAEAFGKIYAILKPNQQSKAPQAFELMAGMFAGTIAAPGGRGRGPGGMGGRQGGGR